jgi:hypothetical protein
VAWPPSSGSKRDSTAFCSASGGDLTATVLAKVAHTAKPLDPKWLKLARMLAR